MTWAEWCGYLDALSRRDFVPGKAFRKTEGSQGAYTLYWDNWRVTFTEQWLTYPTGRHDGRVNAYFYVGLDMPAHIKFPMDDDGFEGNVSEDDRKVMAVLEAIADYRLAPSLAGIDWAAPIMERLIRWGALTPHLEEMRNAADAR